MPILKIENLTMRFGGLEALKDVDIRVEKGEIVGLIGPNGAGKSTLFNVISGFLKPTQGKIYFNGRDITGRNSSKICKYGLVRTFQGTKLFMNLRVVENIQIACHTPTRTNVLGDFLGLPGIRKREREAQDRVTEITKLTRLEKVENELPKNLPHGHQRALGVAIGLAANPKLLCLDEPVTGMNAEEILMMTDVIKRMRDQGITILLVEHSMRTVMGVCDRVVVLDFGEKIAEGTPEEIQCNEEVIRAYLGSSDEAHT